MCGIVKQLRRFAPPPYIPISEGRGITADSVILVVGSQKIVPDLETAFRRIREHVQPWEEAQVRKAANLGTFVGKILIIEREWVNERMTVILVREPIGI